MKYPIFVTRDKINGFNPQLFLDQSVQSAYRGFSYQINNDKYMGHTPSDYDLFQIGTYDSDSGRIEAMEPEFIVNGASVFNEK